MTTRPSGDSRTGAARSGGHQSRAQESGAPRSGTHQGPPRPGAQRSGRARPAGPGDEDRSLDQALAAGPEPGPGRRYLVFDADGELVATFASWDSAHAWSHLRAAEPLTMLPVRIEDHIERRTWTVDADQCRMTVWRRHVEYRVCLPESLLPSSQAHVL